MTLAGTGTPAGTFHGSRLPLRARVAATVTASVANDIMKTDARALAGGDPTTNLIQVGTTATGYTSTGEGSITTVRLFDDSFVQPTNQYAYQFPLGQEPELQTGKFARIRVKAGSAVNAICYMTVEV